MVRIRDGRDGENDGVDEGDSPGDVHHVVGEGDETDVMSLTDDVRRHL